MTIYDICMIIRQITFDIKCDSLKCEKCSHTIGCNMCNIAIDIVSEGAY